MLRLAGMTPSRTRQQLERSGWAPLARLGTRLKGRGRLRVGFGPCREPAGTGTSPAGPRAVRPAGRRRARLIVRVGILAGRAGRAAGAGLDKVEVGDAAAHLPVGPGQLRREGREEERQREREREKEREREGARARELRGREKKGEEERKEGEGEKGERGERERERKRERSEREREKRDTRPRPYQARAAAGRLEREKEEEEERVRVRVSEREQGRAERL